MSDYQHKYSRILDSTLTYCDFEELFKGFITDLNHGNIRAAEKNSQGNWKVNSWVKETILQGFKRGSIVDYGIDENFQFFDKDTYPLRPIDISEKIRLVPGGSSIRSGSYIAPGVVIMPPAYVNVGAYVDSGSMIDSHALVGSCAQVGRNVHISAACQIGGVLEPVNAAPVIIEDNVLLGGNTGIYEGVLVKKGAVIASGVILTASVPVYDLVREKIYRKTESVPLTIPENAVVVMGSRPHQSPFAKEQAIAISTPVIIKYKDKKTMSSVALEEALR